MSERMVAGLEIGEPVYLDGTELEITSIQFGGAHDVNVVLHSRDRRVCVSGDWSKLQREFELEVPWERDTDE